MEFATYFVLVHDFKIFSVGYWDKYIVSFSKHFIDVPSGLFMLWRIIILRFLSSSFTWKCVVVESFSSHPIGGAGPSTWHRLFFFVNDSLSHQWLIGCVIVLWRRNNLISIVEIMRVRIISISAIKIVRLTLLSIIKSSLILTPYIKFITIKQV